MNEIHALSGAYAMDAVDDIERARFEQHLAECAACRAEVASLREAATLLLEMIPSDPQPALRARILDDITKVRRLPPQTAKVARPARRYFPRLVAAAVTALVVGGGTVAVHPWTSDNTQQVSLADRVLTAHDAVRHEVKIGNGTATLVNSASIGHAVVVTDGISNPPAGKAYELWLLIDGTMMPAGLLKSGHDTTMVLTGNSAHAAGAGITIEPKSGSEHPSLPAVGVVEFPAT
ncbi:MAG: anti-sigma factor [Marmoricola sp.]|jgi:hypothetical protein|nr:anti-sigma factor [Marmoricola sp.]